MLRVTQHHILFLLPLLLCTCFGCAQQKTTLPGQETALEYQGDEMDILLSDDYLDDESFPVDEFYDPLEPMNRIFFEFNDKLYYWVLSPLNTAYSAVVPLNIRFSIGNFVNNVATPIHFLNNVLQLKFKNAGVVLSRFVINSTLGVYGFGDPALREFGLEPKQEDFGQTLGYWGVGEGIYLCLPVVGPSTARDTVGFAADVYSHPMVYFVDDYWVSGGYYTGSRVNLLSLNPDVYEDLKKYALDPYVSMRQVYLDYRRKLIDDNPVEIRTDNAL